MRQRGKGGAVERCCSECASSVMANLRAMSLPQDLAKKENILKCAKKKESSNWKKGILKYLSFCTVFILIKTTCICTYSSLGKKIKTNFSYLKIKYILRVVVAGQKTILW